MLGQAQAGLRCLFSLSKTTACKQSQQAKRGGLLVLGVHTVQACNTMAYGLAYGLTYGIARAGPAVSVWLSTGPSVFNGYRSKP